MTKIRIEKNNAFVTCSELLTSNSVNYNTIDLTFVDWEDFTSTFIRFERTDLSPVVSIEFEVTYNTVIIPWEVLRTKGIINISLYGKVDNDVLTTVYTQLTVTEGTSSGSGELPETPSDTVYTQIIDKINAQCMPTGGTINQILVKQSSDDYDAEWQDKTSTTSCQCTTYYVMVNGSTNIEDDGNWKVNVNVDGQLSFSRRDGDVWTEVTTMGASVESDKFILQDKSGRLVFNSEDNKYTIIKPSTIDNGVLLGNGKGRVDLVHNGILKSIEVSQDVSQYVINTGSDLVQTNTEFVYIYTVIVDQNSLSNQFNFANVIAGTTARIVITDENDLLLDETIGVNDFRLGKGTAITNGTNTILFSIDGLPLETDTIIKLKIYTSASVDVVGSNKDMSDGRGVRFIPQSAFNYNALTITDLSPEKVYGKGIITADKCEYISSENYYKLIDTSWTDGISKNITIDNSQYGFIVSKTCTASIQLCGSIKTNDNDWQETTIGLFKKSNSGVGSEEFVTELAEQQPSSYSRRSICGNDIISINANDLLYLKVKNTEDKVSITFYGLRLSIIKIDE